ncbi:MAG: rod shape-determining protein [Armatimonadota bacterium]
MWSGVRETVRGLWSRGLSHFSTAMGIDLGTANTLVHVHGRGIVLCEPSVVAIDTETDRILAVGAEAKHMVGRTPSRIAAIRPMRDGVIADYDVTEAMLAHFIRKACERRFATFPRVVVGVPSGITEVERRAVEEAAKHAGAWRTDIIDEPMAAAIGAGMPVAEATGNMIVDIGGGTTEVAVISLGGICTHRSIRIAGDEIDDAISAHIRREFNLAIGEESAESVKIAIGSAYPRDEEAEMQVRGVDLINGLPKSVNISSSQIREAIVEPLSAIVEVVKQAFDGAAPELAADVMNRGIVLAGGGSLLRGLDQLISAETNIPVYVAEDPMSCVVLGTARYIEELDGVG